MGGAASVDSADSSPEREQPDGRTLSARRISLGEASELWLAAAGFATVSACSGTCFLHGVSSTMPLVLFELS